MKQYAASERTLEELRIQTLVDLVPAVLHRVHNLRLPLGCAVELLQAEPSSSPPPEFLGNFELISAILKKLSTFSSGKFSAGPVNLEPWFFDFNILGRALAEWFDIDFVSFEPRNLVIRDSLGEFCQVGVIALHRHGLDSKGAVRVWARPYGAQAVIGMEFEDASPALEQLLRQCTSFAVRRFGKSLVLRSHHVRVQGAEEPSQPRRRARILLVEEENPFGALTEKVLREAGYAVCSVVPESDTLDQLLQDRWDLILLEHETENDGCKACGLVAASGYPVAFLGSRGLPVPFRPHELIEFVRGKTESEGELSVAER